MKEWISWGVFNGPLARPSPVIPMLDTQAEADDKAIELARKNPGLSFFVCRVHAITQFSVPTPSVVRTPL